MREKKKILLCLGKNKKETDEVMTKEVEGFMANNLSLLRKQKASSSV